MLHAGQVEIVAIFGHSLLILWCYNNFILATFSAGRIIMTISHSICLSTARRQIGLIFKYILGLRKEWICNERPITICPIVTC